MNLERQVFFYIYVFCNILAVSWYLFNGVIDGDLRGYEIKEPMILVLSLISTLAMLYLICRLVYPFISKCITIRPIFVSHNYLYLDLLILLINVSYSLFSIVYNVGMAGVEITGDIPSAPLYIFIILQPTFLVYIYLAFTGDKIRKLLIVNAAIVLVVSLMRGWLTSLMYLSFIAIMLKKDFIVREKFKFIILGVLSLILSPIFRFIKSVSSTVNKSESNISYTNAIEAVIEYKNVTSISDFFNIYLFGLIERFEHAGVLYYVIVDDKVRYLLSNYSSTPFFAEGWIQNRIYNSFFLNDDIDLQFLIADFIYPYVRWRINTTLPVWLYIDSSHILLLISYVFFLMTVCIVLSKLISDRVVNFSWLATLIMLHHGWFYSFSLYLQALFVFVILVFVLRIVSRATS